jgi:hypothetical protein
MLKKEYLFKFLVLAIATGVSFLKLGATLGCGKFVFSGINFVSPLLVVFCNFYIAGAWLLIYFLVKKIMLCGCLTMGIPTFLSATYMCVAMGGFTGKERLTKYLDVLLRIIIPCLCMILFIYHPYGRQAFVYSFYWLIPIVLFVLDKYRIHSSLFSNSLSSTFIAHAAGSVIFLYTLNVAPEVWINLIPIVAIERLTFACGISLFFYVFKFLKNLIYGFKFVVDSGLSATSHFASGKL